MAQRVNKSSLVHPETRQYHRKQYEQLDEVELVATISTKNSPERTRH